MFDQDAHVMHCTRNSLRTKCTAHRFLHVLTCFHMFLHVLGGFYMFLHVLGSFYMFLHVLSKKVVARYSGYFSNMWLRVAIYCYVTGQESVVRKSPGYMPVWIMPLQGWYCKVSSSRQSNEYEVDVNNSECSFTGNKCREKEGPNNWVTEMAKSWS